jgi:hypothetical protein
LITEARTDEKPVGQNFEIDSVLAFGYGHNSRVPTVAK